MKKNFNKDRYSEKEPNRNIGNEKINKSNKVSG